MCKQTLPNPAMLSFCQVHANYEPLIKPAPDVRSTPDTIRHKRLHARGEITRTCDIKVGVASLLHCDLQPVPLENHRKVRFVSMKVFVRVHNKATVLRSNSVSKEMTTSNLICQASSLRKRYTDCTGKCQALSIISPLLGIGEVRGCLWIKAEVFRSNNPQPRVHWNEGHRTGVPRSGRAKPIEPSYHRHVLEGSSTLMLLAIREPSADLSH